MPNGTSSRSALLFPLQSRHDDTTVQRHHRHVRHPLRHLDAGVYGLVLVGAAVTRLVGATVVRDVPTGHRTRGHGDRCGGGVAVDTINQPVECRHD